MLWWRRSGRWRGARRGRRQGGRPRARGQALLGGPQSREPDRESPARWRRRRSMAAMAPSPLLPRWRSTMRAQSPALRNGPGCAARSQREVAPGDHIVGLAQAEDVDELAGVLKAAQGGAVGDDVLGEPAGEAWHDLQLFDG